ncbi:MAG: AmmeMemoRadiSam system protein B [Gammaproteobacteria bacterium]
MKSIRKAAVAGTFYPNDASELKACLDTLMRQTKVDSKHLKAIIAPHAGYIYSGPVAASAYSCFIGQPLLINRVVLLGPAHRVSFHGVAASSADFFTTPLGKIAVDHDSLQVIVEHGLVKYFDLAHEQEHCFEVQLPFLQQLFNGNFKIIPLVVGDTNPSHVAKVLRALWGGPETLVVISSDLSHYQDHETAKRLDQQTTQSIEQFHGEELDYESACGCLPIQGLLKIAKELDMQCKTLDLRNSGDTTGSHDRVVGYGAYAFY